MALKLAVLISGRGSNLVAISRAIDAGRCDAQIALVVSDRASAAGLAFAAERSLPCEVIAFRNFSDRAAWDRALTERVAAAAPDLVVTAGFMRMLGAPFLERF